MNVVSIFRVKSLGLEMMIFLENRNTHCVLYLIYVAVHAFIFHIARARAQTHVQNAITLFICMLHLYANTLNEFYYDYFVYSKFGTFNHKIYVTKYALLSFSLSLHERTPDKMQHMEFTKTSNKRKHKQTNEKQKKETVDIPKIANSKCISFKHNTINIVACLSTKITQ